MSQVDTLGLLTGRPTRSTNMFGRVKDNMVAFFTNRFVIIGLVVLVIVLLVWWIYAWGTADDSFSAMSMEELPLTGVVRRKSFLDPGFSLYEGDVPPRLSRPLGEARRVHMAAGLLDETAMENFEGRNFSSNEAFANRVFGDGEARTLPRFGQWFMQPRDQSDAPFSQKKLYL